MHMLIIIKIILINSNKEMDYLIFMMINHFKLLVNYENNVKNATSLKNQFENWYLAMPVLSFNGSKYDIN
jgi:hypothetical protein